MRSIAVYSQLGSVQNWIYQTARFEASTTVWGTPFAEWGLDVTLPAAQQNFQNGDIRVQFYKETTAFGATAPKIGADNRRPFWRQSKYANANIAVAIARGTEMKLILAEADLVRGDWQQALAHINEVRTYHQGRYTAQFRPPSVTATNIDETWTLLMKERGIEMWLEGRRLPDYRRWAVTPGNSKIPFTKVRKSSGQANPSTDPRVPVYANVPKMCLEVGQNEKLTNPSIRG